MFELPGYRTVESVGGNEEVRLYRLSRLEDGQSVIAKTTSDEYPGRAKVESFRHEYEILRKLGGRGAVEPYSLEMMRDRPVLLSEDIGGFTLDQMLLMSEATPDLPALLNIAAAVADCVMQLHREQITLNEITPFHLMVNPGTYEVKFIDIRMCSTALSKSPLSIQANRPNFLLPYISPEQTGRTGVTPDYRSDFYSLGITLYEWLTGSLPFEQQSVVDIVYRHLASTPEPVHVRAAAIPSMVSHIIGKCIEKMPDARYASAFGIKSDLEECLVRFRDLGKVESFTLAGQDIRDRWLIPANLYGRSSEQQSLRQALQRASEGTAEVVWVSGNGGIGKTSFVQETLRKDDSFEGFFATGKYDSNHTSLPYDVWIQAIGELVDQLLTESEMQGEVWKLRILNAISGYGHLLIELVPRLELLIGKQPPVQLLPPVESQHRFHLILNRFIQLFLDQEHPLVLFFDDLQWADEASLQYLSHLLEDRDSRHLLVIGAYRDGEITPEHQLRKLKKQLQERKTSIQQIHLKTLEIDDLKQLLQDAIRSESTEIDALATILLHKTEGNPFFLKQFLQDLVERGLVAFDESCRCWQWNLQPITEMNVPDNAVDYISDKLKHLPVGTIHVLGRAAFLGGRFDLDTLVCITGLSAQELSETLGTAVHESLLQPVSGGSIWYRFQHDRIQQAAYDLVSEAERPDLHLRIGRLLRDRMKAGGEGNLFEAVNQLNMALERIAHPEQRLELAELNLQAGIKAKQSTAYETALGYFRNATALLGEDCWDNHYPLAFSAYKEQAESEYLCAYFETANDLFNLLMQKSITNLDKALVCTMMIQLESNKDNYEEVIALGKKALGLLDIDHKFKPTSFELTSQWLRLLWKLRKHPIESLHSLPPMTDESRKVAMSVLVHIGNACFVVNKKGWVASSFTMIEMTLDYGITPESSIGFVGYAMFLYFQFRQYRGAYEWGRLACTVSKPYPALYAKALTSFSLCYDSWRQYDPSFLGTFTDHVAEMGLESGDLWHGNQSVIINCALLLKYDHPLGDIYNRLVARSSDFQRNNNSLLWNQASILTALMSRLTGYCAPEDPYNKMDVYTEGFAESIHGDEFDIIREAVCLYHYMTGYLLGNYREANHYLMQSALIIEERQDENEYSTQYMFESLVWAELYEEDGERERGEYLANMRDRLNKLKKYAVRCPENYQHKYLLIKAEIARLTHKDHKAEELYEQAIEDARAHGHSSNLGIAAECFAKYGLKRGKLHLAKIYMTEAYEAYLKWGALAKTVDLQERYGHLLNLRPESGVDRVDYLSVVMSAQALSGEMEMNRLLKTLMRIMLQNAGAEFGALIFEHEGIWAVEAYGTAENVSIESIPLEDAAGMIPSSIIGYTARTKEEVVLHDATSEGMFVRNDYVKAKRLKSVLCLPIMHQNKLICLLYMENKLSPGVFTPQRMDVLKLLCSQCAISIENARLYSDIQYLKNNLEDQVEERTRSLERSMRETSAALVDKSVYAERNRIAQEIHDVVGHGLTSTILQIEAGKRLMHKEDMEGAVMWLQGAQDLVRHSLNEIRGSVHMLKEGQDFDLVLALNQLVQNTGVVVHADIHDLPELSSAHKKVIYHALQEGLTNGIRHGGSREFHFHLENIGSILQFSLEDNGVGSDGIQMGFGLKAMKERVEQLGGSLHIVSQPSKGLLLRIDLPHSTYMRGDMG